MLSDKNILDMSFGNNPNRRQYEEDLARHQKEHLEKVYKYNDSNWQPCLHDKCPNCHGTGVKLDGSHCVHMLSCNCPKCKPSFLNL